jgi:hypothetical protein
MSQQTPTASERPPVQSTVQAAGRVAEDVVAGLRASPLMLGLVIVNLTFVGVAGYAMHSASVRKDELLNTFAKHIAECVPKDLMQKEIERVERRSERRGVRAVVEERERMEKELDLRQRARKELLRPKLDPPAIDPLPKDEYPPR